MADDTFQTIAGLLGNVFEWYDFGIYGFFSDTIAQVFFPPTNSAHHNLIYIYLVFGGAFLMRPMGGLITGHIGDMHGRKGAVVFSLFAMTIPTVAMGCLPTYEQVGSWSTALLVICRLLQGFSVGGQLPSSLVYTLERKPKEHWGYYGSMISLSNTLGSVLGNLVGALLRTLLIDDQLLQWGWRVAFLSGVLIAPLAVYLHVYGAEHNPNAGEYDDSEEGASEEGASEKGGSIISSVATSLRQSRPLKEALRRENLPALISSCLTPMLGGAGYYITFVWMAIFMTTLIDPPVHGAFWVNLLAGSCGLMLTSIGTGWLSDRYGRNKVMIAGAVTVGSTAPVFIWIISWGNTWKAFGAQWAIGVLLSLHTGPMYAWMVEKFPPKIRLTSFSLGYNLGICISAGFSPAVATQLVHSYGVVAPGFIYTFFAVVSLIGMFISTKVHREDEDGKEYASLARGGASNTIRESSFMDEAITHLL